MQFLKELSKQSSIARGLVLFTRQSNQERLGPVLKLRERPLLWTPPWPERSLKCSQTGGALDPPSLEASFSHPWFPECLSTTVTAKHLALFSSSADGKAGPVVAPPLSNQLLEAGAEYQSPLPSLFEPLDWQVCPQLKHNIQAAPGDRRL